MNIEHAITIQIQLQQINIHIWIDFSSKASIDSGIQLHYKLRAKISH